MATQPTQTLRRIKRRQLQLYEPRTALPSSSCPRLPSDARPPTPIPGYHPQTTTTCATVVACDGNTEGIHSAEVEASTSRYLCFDDADSLEDSFPSILKLIDSLGRVCHGNDPAAFSALASVFATVVIDVASCITASELVDHTRERFILAKSIVHLLLNAFVSTINKVGDLKSCRGRHRQLEMRDAFEYAKMVHESLAMLYLSGLKKSLKNKSLPPLPFSQVFQGPYPLGTASTATRSNITVNQIDRLVHIQSDEQSQRRKDNASNRPALNRRSSLPCLSLWPAAGSRIDNYNQRHTLLFFGEARMPSTLSYFDDAGGVLKSTKSDRIQAVSVPSLISIITSGESPTDLGLTQAILASFRLFITPTEFFQGLKERFELKCSMNPEDASQWVSKMSNIRANVLAVIYSWLDQHWQADSDAVVLGTIRAFVEEQSASDSHAKLSTLLTKIESREGRSGEDLLDERRRYIATTSPARTPPPDGTKFIFPQTFHASSDGLLQLDTDDGREELSRHLTMKMSHLYRQLDPDKTIRFWYKEGESCRNYDKFKDEPSVKDLAAISAYGEQLTLCIISSILDISDIEGRAERMSLWTDVASRCMAHCDYATAHNIYASLSFSAIRRLKKTIMTIPYASKVQYKKLEDFFQNEKMFRETFADLRPSLPSSTAPLIKDIIHVKNRVGKDKALSQESSTDALNSTSKQKFIFFDEIRVLQQATRVLNKALIEYKFHEHKDLSQWLDGRLKEFCTIDTKSVYKRLYETSKERESRQINLSNPWEYNSSRPSSQPKGRFRLAWLGFRLLKTVDGEKGKKRNAAASFALLKTLAFG